MEEFNEDSIASSKSLELYEWIEQHKDLHLTIKDIKELKVGDELDVSLFDPNV